MSHKYFSPEVVSADTEALKFRLKLFIYPTNISWDISLWKVSSCKHQSLHTCSNLARSMKSCWNLLAWTISIFVWQFLMNFRSFLFSSLGYGVLRIGKWERMVEWASSTVTWRRLQTEKCFLEVWKHCQNWSGVFTWSFRNPDGSEVSVRNHRKSLSN